MRMKRLLLGLIPGLLLASSVGADSPPEMPSIEAGVATAVALRGLMIQLEPPPTPPPPETTNPPQYGAPSGLSDCDEMRWYRINAGLPSRFDAIGWRESNCRNEDGVRTYCCYGYWQLYVSIHLRDPRLGPRYRACGVNSADDVNSDTVADKLRQACAAKAVYDIQPGAW